MRCSRAGTTCPKSNPPPNAVRVVEKTTVPTFFMKLFGVFETECCGDGDSVDAGPGAAVERGDYY